MLFRETADRQDPTIIFLHGGGLSSWSLKMVVEGLRREFHIVTPIIDGHGECADEEFLSIEDCAGKLIKYIDENHRSRVFAICGLSIGAQIVTEILSQRPDISKYAVIESALVYPIKAAVAATVPAYWLMYGLIKRRWFSRLQAKALFVPDWMFEEYYRDSLAISKRSLCNIALSNGTYRLKAEISNTRSKVLIIAGGREAGIMKKSAQSLHRAIKGSELHIAPNMRHGELSLANPEKYISLLRTFFEPAD